MDYNLWFMIVFDCVWLFLNDCVWLCMIVLWSYQLYAYKDMDWRSWPRMMSQQEFRHGSSSAYAKPMLPYLQGWTINCPIIVMWKPGGSIVPWVLTRTQPVAPLAPQAAQQTMQYVVLYLIPTLVEALAVLRWYGAWRSISLHHEGIWLGDFGSPSNEVRKKTVNSFWCFFGSCTSPTSPINDVDLFKRGVLHHQKIQWLPSGLQLRFDVSKFRWHWFLSSTSRISSWQWLSCRLRMIEGSSMVQWLHQKNPSTEVFVLLNLIAYMYATIKVTLWRKKYPRLKLHQRTQIIHIGVVDSPTVAACLPQIQRGWLENHPFDDFPRKTSTFWNVDFPATFDDRSWPRISQTGQRHGRFRTATTKHDNDLHDRLTDSLVNYEVTCRVFWDVLII